MALTIDDLNLKVELPRLPRSIRLLETESPSLDQRSGAIKQFTRTLKLGDLQPVDLPDRIAYAGKRGEVEFYPASGAIWARDAEAEQAHDDELRKWPDLKEERRGRDVIFSLGRGAADELLRQAHELLRAAELVSENMKPIGVALEQVTHLSEKGEILERGAGGAAVRFGYELDGVPAFGAGAKSEIFAEPNERGVHITGAFHCWRPTNGSRDVRLPSIEEALAVGVLQDPELNLYHKKGGRIEVTKLEFGYMALPAMVHQRFLFPVFQVEGKVHTPKDEKQRYFEFARYHHAVPPEAYRKAGAFADYLVKRND